MISNLISKTDCAECEFCCTYYRNEIWEALRFSKEILPEIKKICPEAKFKSLTETIVTQELADLYTNISIFGKWEEISGPFDFEPGLHSLILEDENTSDQIKKG